MKTRKAHGRQRQSFLLTLRIPYESLGNYTFNVAAGIVASVKKLVSVPRHSTNCLSLAIEPLEERWLLALAFSDFIDPNPNPGNQFGESVVNDETGASIDTGAVTFGRVSSGIAAISLRTDGNNTGNVGATFSDQSATGRFVVFRSSSTNLVGGVNYTTGFNSNIFRRDRLTGKTELVSVSHLSPNRTPNAPSFNAYISPNGRFVAFESDGNDLVQNDTNHEGHDIFVRDMVEKKTYLINVTLQGNTKKGATNFIRESDQTDGTFITNNGFITFQSNASNLVQGDNNGHRDVFVRDFIDGRTYLANTNSAGQAGQGPSDHGVLSANGRFVAFESYARNLIPGDVNFNPKIFRKNLETGTTVLVSNNDLQNGSLETGGSFLPKISNDGKVIVFESFRRLSSQDANNADRDVYVRDMRKSKPDLVSVSETGGPANSTSFDPNISGNGRFVVFESLASNLTPRDQDPNTVSALTDLDNKDVFRRDLANGITTLVSFNYQNTRDAQFESRNIDVSENGRFVTWESQSRNLVNGFKERNDNVFAFDIFRRDMVTEKTTLVTGSQGSATVSSNNGANFPVISADGRYITFHSTSSDLVSRDTNSQTDVFASPALFTNPQSPSHQVGMLLPQEVDVATGVDVTLRNVTTSATDHGGTSVTTPGFAVGETIQAFTVTPDDDSIGGADESFEIRLGSVVVGGRAVNAPASASIVTISNDPVDNMLQGTGIADTFVFTVLADYLIKSWGEFNQTTPKAL